MTLDCGCEDSPFLETHVLIAVMNGVITHARQLLKGSLPYELRNLMDGMDDIAGLVEAELDEL